MSPIELKSLSEGLYRNHYGRMQFRNGYKTDVKSFCIVRVAQRAPYRLEGHLSGPRGNNARFTCEVVSQQVVIRVTPEEGNRTRREELLSEIMHALEMMMSRVAKGPIQGRIGTKHWRGFYLVNLGDRSVSKRGLAHFEDAVQSGVISRPFSESCIDYGFTMMKRA